MTDRAALIKAAAEALAAVKPHSLVDAWLWKDGRPLVELVVLLESEELS